MKKGISPLVATILLIGFVVVIAVTVWFWYRGVVEEQAQKTATTTTAQFSCTLVSIVASNSYCSESEISFDLENKGTVTLSNFRVIVNGDDQQTSELSQQILPSGKVNTGIGYDSSVTGTPTTITIIPVVSGTTCEEQKLVLSLDCPPSGNNNQP